MNISSELLRDYLTENKITQRQYAEACGVGQSFISQVLAGTIAISALNLSKLLSGVRLRDAQLAILIAYLRDQIPSEYVHDLVIHLSDSEKLPILEEADMDPATVFVAAIAEVAGQLPQQTRALLYDFTQALRIDPALRNVFQGIMRYVPAPAGTPADSAGPFPIELIKAAQARKLESNMSNPEAHTHVQSAPKPKRVRRPSNKKSESP